MFNRRFGIFLATATITTCFCVVFMVTSSAFQIDTSLGDSTSTGTTSNTGTTTSTGTSSTDAGITINYPANNSTFLATSAIPVRIVSRGALEIRLELWKADNSIYYPLATVSTQVSGYWNSSFTPYYAPSGAYILRAFAKFMAPAVSGSNPTYYNVSSSVNLFLQNTVNSPTATPTVKVTSTPYTTTTVTAPTPVATAAIIISTPTPTATVANTTTTATSRPTTSTATPAPTSASAITSTGTASPATIATANTSSSPSISPAARTASATTAPTPTATANSALTVTASPSSLPSQTTETAAPATKKPSLTVNFENTTLTVINTPTPAPEPPTATATNPTALPTATPTATASSTPSTQKAIRFFGVALPNSDVEITIHSDPLVIHTQADANGNWSYILTDPLDPGKHSVTVAIIDPQTNQSVSQSSDFFIAKAVAASTLNGKSLTLEDPQTLALKQYLEVASLIMILAVLMLIWAFIERRKHQMKVEDEPEE